MFVFVLQIIHLTWSPGIKSKQTLADDDRSVSVVISLKLSGTPWNQAVYNSGKATIQARLIVLEIVRILSQHKWRFAANVNFSGTTDSFFFQVTYIYFFHQRIVEVGIVPPIWNSRYLRINKKLCRGVSTYSIRAARCRMYLLFFFTEERNKYLYRNK